MGSSKVFFFGNVNNYPLWLAQGFLALGRQVTLVVNSTLSRHNPNSYLSDNEIASLPGFTVVDGRHLTPKYLAENKVSVKNFIQKYSKGADLAILNDTGPSVSRYLNCPHMAFLTGSDLTTFASPRWIEQLSSGWSQEYLNDFAGHAEIKHYRRLVKDQQNGIRSAFCVSFAAKGLIPEGDGILEEFGIKDRDRMFIFLSCPRALSQIPIARSRKNRLRILNGARILWKKTHNIRPTSQDLKATNLLLDGFVNYVRKGGSGILTLVKKGNDVSEAERFIEEQKIANQVVWMPEVSLNEFGNVIKAHDLVIDQLGHSFPGMVTTQAIALGRPTLANLRQGVFPFDLPGLNAETAQQVSDQLFRAQNNREELNRLGELSRRFAGDHLSGVSYAKEIIERLKT